MQPLEIAFFSKITASMTHEMKNALAIIQESSGLMSDLLTLGQKTPFPFQEKFEKVLAAIDEQVRRGVEIATRLNRFAHSLDAPRAAANLNELVEQTAFLMQRLALRHKLKIQVLPAAVDLMVETDLFRLHLVLAAVIEHLIEALEAGGVITMQPQVTDQGVEVTVLGQGGLKPGQGESGESTLPETFMPLQPILEDLGCHLIPSGATGGLEYKLVFY